MKFFNEMGENIFKSKYLTLNEKTAEQAVERVTNCLFPYMETSEFSKSEMYDYIDKQYIIPGGGIWRAAGNKSNKVSFVNCTTLNPPEDNLESIFHSLYLWAKYAAYGQGEGVDISKLRPKNADLNNSARYSTGAVSFMPIFDAVLKVIAQQGRRGASLISIKDTHPDLLDFIKIKSKSGVLETANISIHISDAFMNAIKNNNEWELKWNDDKQVISKKYQAMEIFNEIAQSAWSSGEPGLQYFDTIKRYSNSEAFGYNVVSSNACSEQLLDPDNVCMLSHLNFAKVNEYDFEKMVRFGIYFLDACLKAEYAENRSPYPNQRKKIIEMPRIGLGITGLADYFIDNGIVYGSEQSITTCNGMFAELARIAYSTSYEIACKRGSFPGYDINKYSQSQYINNLIENKILDPRILDKQAHVAKLSLAPVGTGSIIANVGGSGVEPIFSKYMVRRERASTGEWKEWFIFNPVVEKHLTKLGKEITRENVDALTDKKWVTAHTLDPMDKIKVMGVIQKYIDSGISVTYNLPETADVEMVKKIFFTAWENNLKGVAVYREGSRDGVLITESNYNKNRKRNKRVAKPRPAEIWGKVFKYKEYTVIIGLVDDKPYEIFGGIEKNDLSDGWYDKIVKKGKRHYEIGGINILTLFKDSSINMFTRLISMSLRHGVPLQFVVEQLEKEGSLFAINKVFARFLKMYIDEKEEVLSSVTCVSCGSGDIIYINGCKTCTKCGYSLCG